MKYYLFLSIISRAWLLFQRAEFLSFMYFKKTFIARISFNTYCKI
jgi:hypothetical protein